MASQQIQFYQYRPDSDARHNAVFTPMPAEQPIYGQMVAYPPQVGPQYWQPVPQHMMRAHFTAHGQMTPGGSPPLTLAVPMPKIIVDQNGQLEHGHFLQSPTPPTPCLSVCPSTVSSPPASAIQQTPTHHGYFNLPLESSKEDVQAHSIPLLDDWSESTRKLQPITRPRGYGD